VRSEESAYNSWTGNLTVRRRAFAKPDVTRRNVGWLNLKAGDAPQ
jgi:hypothetical protein